jgi:hypothetical protein
MPQATLPFVGDSQPLPALCAAACKHDPAILGRHSDPEAVRLGAAAFIRLVSALALHDLLFA